MKKVFKWIILDDEKFYMVEEVPLPLANNRYRFQYKLVPILRALKDMGYNCDETEEINQSLSEESSV